MSVYLSDGLEKEKADELFKTFLYNRIKKSSGPVFIWDYDIRELDLSEFDIQYIDIDFLTMRIIQDGILRIKSKIVVLNSFSLMPNKVQVKLMSDIKNNKYKCLFIFMDTKHNRNKISDDLLDEMIHFNVQNK